MPLFNVYTDQVRPHQVSDYEEGVRALASAARKTGEKMPWTAHQTEFGTVGKFYYVIRGEDHAELERFGDAAALFTRVLGNSGVDAFRRIQACVVSSERSISTERLDLSYPQEPAQVAAPLASIARIHAQQGRQGDVEELLRKIAEATAKLGNVGRIAVSQRLTGDMSEYVIARPLQNLAELDSQPIGQDALVAAFGKKEGERVFRSGSESIQTTDREILALREDLSNIPN